MDALLSEVVKFLPAGQLVVIGLLVWIVRKVTHTNGTVIELKAWRQFHEEMEAERFKRVYDQLRRDERRQVGVGEE